MQLHSPCVCCSVAGAAEQQSSHQLDEQTAGEQAVQRGFEKKDMQPATLEAWSSKSLEKTLCLSYGAKLLG